MTPRKREWNYGCMGIVVFLFIFWGLMIYWCYPFFTKMLEVMGG